METLFFMLIVIESTWIKNYSLASTKSPSTDKKIIACTNVVYVV